MKKILNFIASLGSNVNFLAQVGHFSAGFILVSRLPGSHLVWALAITAYASVKEYWFDTKYEHATFWDNTLDFSMYCVGAWLAFAFPCK